MEVKEKITLDEDGKQKFVGRDWNNRESYKDSWWVFGEPRRDFRPALKGLSRYIVTVETTKHRIFQFLSTDILPDNMLICVADIDGLTLGVLSSRIHITWSLRAGGWLGIGNDPRYSKSKVFDPFPFPDPDETLKKQIRAVAEELDAFRKARQAEHPSLTLTQMYNVLEKLKAIEAARLPSPLWGGVGGGVPSGDAETAASPSLTLPRTRGREQTTEVGREPAAASRAAAPTLTPEEERIKDEGLILILRELHERLDHLVFQAYGWPETLSDEQILERLVALNHERAAEEKRGKIRWLRPDYQIPRFGKQVDKQAAKEEGAQIAVELALPEAAARKPSFPTDAVGQTAAVFAALVASAGPLDVAAIAAGFRKSKNLEKTIAGVLASLARLGHAATRDGKTFDIRRVA